ncbi:MAG TPA: cytochrome c maturation protein CcmE [Candidatus Dormibacteraeota bacterium]|nr:cytochrome c maturation protein CcmE [Candidatus Dormibacteraeota bacterium]
MSVPIAARAERWRPLRALRWWVLVAVVVACLGYLLISVTGATAEYYQTIPELHRHPTTAKVRVLGTVQGGIVRSADGQEVRFKIAGGGQTIPVVYRGTLPDIFKPGVQVVVDGHLASSGVFQADQLETKCPSRFSSATAQGMPTS